jgi:hypothetical protein
LCCSAIQVNIVNAAVNDPIDGGEEYTVESLNEKSKEGFRLDIEALEQDKRTATPDSMLGDHMA